MMVIFSSLLYLAPLSNVITVSIPVCRGGLGGGGRGGPVQGPARVLAPQRVRRGRGQDGARPRRDGRARGAERAGGQPRGEHHEDRGLQPHRQRQDLLHARGARHAGRALQERVLRAGPAHHQHHHHLHQRGVVAPHPHHLVRAQQVASAPRARDHPRGRLQRQGAPQGGCHVSRVSSLCNVYIPRASWSATSTATSPARSS